MMKSRMKYKAVFLALCMVVSAFALVLPAVTGHETAGPGSDEEVRLVVLWDDDWMENDPMVVATDEEVIFNYDDNVGSMYYLGDNTANIEIDVWLDDTDNLDNVVATLQSTGIVSIVDGTDSPPGAWNGGNTETFQFTIDIATSGAVETTYPMTLSIDYDDTTSAQNNQQDTFDLEIYVSSVFDDASSAGLRDIHDGLPDIEETDSDSEFEAGVDMQEGEIELTQYASFGITDVEGTLSNVGAGVTVTGGFNTAVNPSPGNPFSLFWRFDAAPDAMPDFYAADLALQYERDDTQETIQEFARGTGLYVDYTPRITASLSNAVTITQNELEATLDVVFTNQGNVDLFDLMVTPATDGQWLDVSFNHYENEDDTYESTLDLGDLAEGDPSTAIQVIVASDMMLPDGLHRVPFDWNGWYYEDGSTGDASRWVEVGGEMYDHDANLASPEVELLYEDDDENGVYTSPGVPPPPVGDTILETEWDGAFVDFTVDDTNGLTWEAFVWDTVADAPGRINAGDDGNVRYTTITVRIFNFEFVTYNDLDATLTVGPTTPFLDPANHASVVPLPMDPPLSTTVPAGSPGTAGTLDIPFTVDINSAWWQAGSLAPETYWAQMTVAATNDDSEERITGTNVPVKTDIIGFGPELFASLVTITDFDKPGDTFTMSVQIENFGDDIAREVDAYLMADFVSGWTILDQFVSSISSYGGTGDGQIGDASWGWSQDQWHQYWDAYEQWNRSNDIKPSDVGVDNVPQIVELYDWMKRRESPPQGVLLWMHLDRLAPGETHTFVFEMVSDVNMVEGMVYYETVALYYHDSNGDDYGPNGDPMGTVEDHYAPPQQLLVRKGKGTEYAGEDELDLAVVIAGIIIAIVILIFFLLGTFIGGRGKSEGKYSESDSYSPPPGGEYEPDMPPEGGDEGPPFPEEGPK